MLDVSLIQFCLVWNKTTIFNMHHIIKTKMNVIDITYVFCCCNVHIVFVYCKKKVVNILWIMHELCQCLIFFFSQFSFQNLIMKPFCISHMLSTLFFLLKKIPLDLLHTMLLQACWYKNTVSSSLQCTCTCMNVRQYVR